MESFLPEAHRLAVGFVRDASSVGDKVKVHYTGKLLDGTKFDSSRDRSAAFEFTVGRGVIAGWSEAVPTMCVGEVASFTIASNKAYGPGGSPPTIPPDATLVFEIELLSFSDREDLNRDGTVMKKVITPGHGHAVPNERCDVKIVVEVTMLGGRADDVFKAHVEWPASASASASASADPSSSSQQRAKKEAAAAAPSFLPPAPLTLPCGFVLPASLRGGIESMKKQERSSFHLAASPGLAFECIILSWVENEECVEGAPGAVVKRVEKEADEEVSWKSPRDCDAVKVRGTVKDSAGILVADFGAIGSDEDGPPTAWTVDEHAGTALRGDVAVPLCDGVEHVLKKMKCGEVCTARIHPRYGYAAQATSSRLPAKQKTATMPDDEVVVVVDHQGGQSKEDEGDYYEAHLELCEITEEEGPWDLNFEDRLALVLAKRALGNGHFGRDDLDRAVRRYSTAIDCAATDDPDPDRKATLGRAQDAARLNRAMCHLKLGNFAEARADCDAVLPNDPTNPKALFRRARALTELDEWADARADLKTLLNQDPANAQARRALADIAKRQKALDAKQKALYAGKRLFSKKKDDPTPNKQPPRPTPPPSAPPLTETI